MNAYEALLDEANTLGLVVKEIPLQSSDGRIYGNKIGIRNSIETSIKKACTLAEEIGHNRTSYGDILDLSTAANNKQEHQARVWGYDKLIGLNGLIRAFEHGCKNEYEIAEYLEVTHEYLVEAIEHYKRKYGIYTVVDNYLIYFIPCLIVGKLLKK